MQAYEKADAAPPFKSERSTKKSALLASSSFFVLLIAAYATFYASDCRGRGVEATRSLLNKNGDPNGHDRDRFISVLQATMDSVRKLEALASDLSNNENDDRAFLRNCLQFFQDTIHRLGMSLDAATGLDFQSPQTVNDVRTWLSAALTNQNTCLNGFDEIHSSSVAKLMSIQVGYVSQEIAASLGLFTNLSGAAPCSPQPRRSRRVLVPLMTAADLVVAQDGSGDYKTIEQALKAIPIARNLKRFVVYIKAGRYYENVVIPFNMTGLVFVGDGMDRTVVTSNRTLSNSKSLVSSATIAVWGDGFVAKGMTFENTAGSEGQQAVALFVAADRAVFYSCSIVGYQDTLFLHSNRQFLRDCLIYGTIDFIFGNAAAVIQKSYILVRKPVPGQSNVITAQGRENPSQLTGFSIHACTVSAAPDLEPVVSSFHTYLGRPWEQYSRTVFMQSNIGGLIDPAGWLEWHGNARLATLYYGEFRNYGAGSNTSERVDWPGFHVIEDPAEAEQFTVGKFICGGLWIPSSGVPFDSGLY